MRRYRAHYDVIVMGFALLTLFKGNPSMKYPHNGSVMGSFVVLFVDNVNNMVNSEEKQTVELPVTRGAIAVMRICTVMNSKYSMSFSSKKIHQI